MEKKWQIWGLGQKVIWPVGGLFSRKLYSVLNQIFYIGPWKIWGYTRTKFTLVNLYPTPPPLFLLWTSYEGWNTSLELVISGVEIWDKLHDVWGGGWAPGPRCRSGLVKIQQQPKSTFSEDTSWHHSDSNRILFDWTFTHFNPTSCSFSICSLFFRSKGCRQFVSHFETLSAPRPIRSVLICLGKQQYCHLAHVSDGWLSGNGGKFVSLLILGRIWYRVWWYTRLIGLSVQFETWWGCILPIFHPSWPFEYIQTI